MRSLLPSNSRDYYLDYHIKPLFADKHSLKVTLDLPADAPRCDTFCFADQVPGAYEIRHYAKFIRNLVAVGTKGDTIPCVLVDSSFFMVDTTQSVSHISYEVLPTYNAKTDSVMLFTGTYFNDGCYQINPYAVFGFFRKLSGKPIRIIPEVPPDWSIGTALMEDSTGNLYADDLFELLDSPILLGDISYAAFKYNEKRCFIYTHSDNGNVRSKDLKKVLRNAIQDADNFMGGFPSDNYSFLVNVINDTIRRIGAHEHLFSSIYGFGSQKKPVIKTLMKLFARHELFHTLSPLSLQSREVYDNKYTGRHPVSHLWFYEGVAQWAAFKMSLMSHAISAEGFLNVVSNTLTNGDTEIDSLSLIDCSDRALMSHELVADIYRRGLVFGALLDIHLINRTAGRVTLREVLLKMKDRYPLGRPFDTDSLFQVIASLSDPEVKGFLEHYLKTNDTLPIREELGRLGISYSSKKQHPQVKAGLGFYPYNDKVSGRMIVRDVFTENSSTGYKPHDTLLTVDGENFAIGGTNPELVRRLFFSSPGTSYTAVVLRNGKEVFIHAKTVPYYLRHVFSIQDEVSPEVLALRHIWMTR
jgi:predicted metalloprotease with PDZ domain